METYFFMLTLNTICIIIHNTDSERRTLMFDIDFKSREPVYEQIKTRIINLVLSNSLSANEQLPAVRQLALQLSVNPNTVQKAYEQLEMEGIIYSLQGRGSFIAENNKLYDEYKKKLHNNMEKIVNNARSMNFKKDTVVEVFNDVIGQWEE